ncbi:30S ribosomal protein S20 [Ruficoccus sp. ZRK36]|uniref:30S ribosomal protein S20 n=1 Tax=Ruficoccus sp. ZRK36 TaxID=2866311 RepID=UPI001C73B295|nr:30S ribosomal protein S20 [Ruficoccus sp. ZRK36]QYY37182.1 30S ribosomal protein S20 [Ruficoccus sp. ZRK36]
MANTKQAQKYIRKTEVRTERNRNERSRLKTLAKRARTAEGEEGTKVAREYASALDKAVKRGVIHANKAARQKSSISAKAFAKA